MTNSLDRSWSGLTEVLAEEPVDGLPEELSLEVSEGDFDAGKGDVPVYVHRTCPEVVGMVWAPTDGFVADDRGGGDAGDRIGPRVTALSRS